MTVTQPPTQSEASLDVPGLEEDAEGTRVVREELRLLATVHRALSTAGQAADSVARAREDYEARLLQLRDDAATAKPEDLPALFDQMHQLEALMAQRGRGATGQVDLRSPYFAHLRLEENGKRRDVLIGGRSYLDTNAGVRIVDWRHAPVSKIYYRYGEGDDYEELLGDRMVEGVVTARRSVAVVDGELVRVACTQGTFLRGKDGRWRRLAAHVSRLRTEKRDRRGEGGERGRPGARLGVGADGQLRTDKHLPAIAALLDERQFELIARPGAGLVAIQGSAGSGKTTVGLHRVAYLAFSDPRRFKPESMLVLVPNEALIHYVARVLPSLEVNGVAVTTFTKFARRLVLSTFPKLPTRIHEDTPPVVSRAKEHARLLHAIDELGERLVARFETRIREAMPRWPGGDQVIAAWAATTKVGSSADARLTALAQWLVGKRSLDGIGAAQLPDVTKSAVESLGAELRQQARNVVAAWDELLTNRELLGRTFEGVPGFAPAQLDQVHEWCVRQARIRHEGERDGEEPTLDAEDDALLLRLWQAIRGPLLDGDGKPLRFSHVFVDEVQDSNPIALRVILDLTGKERCVTLAGDMAQRMLDEGDARGEFDWHALLAEMGAASTALEPLKVSYRSTAEITSFARGVLGPFAHEAEPIATRHGPPVELFEFGSTGEAVAFLADALKQLLAEEPYANVALVARFGPQADVYYEGLERAEVPNVRRVRRQDFTWEPGVDVTDVRQTKGLEFDEVVLLDTNASSYPATPPARHALYVGATRAAHQLWCVASDAPSPIVGEGLAAQDAAAAAAG